MFIRLPFFRHASTAPFSRLSDSSATIRSGSNSQLVGFAIDAGADKALLVDRAERFLVFAFPPADQRREDHDLRAGRVTHDRVDDLTRRLSGDLSPALPAVRRAGAGEEDAQVVVD